MTWAIPIPESYGGQRVVLGEPGDPTRDDVRPCEYLVTPSALYPGRPCFTALVALDDDERQAIATGACLFLTLDGAEVAWSISVEASPEPTT